MDYRFGVFAIICLIILALIVELAVVILVAGAVATTLGFTGVLWWLVVILVFLMINSVLGGLLLF